MELQGFLVIQWPAIHAFLTAKAQLLDQNGDGKLDHKDVQVLAVRGGLRAPPLARGLCQLCAY